MSYSPIDAVRRLTQKRNLASRGQHKTMVIRDVCLPGQLPTSKKNAHRHNGKPTHPCQEDGRPSVDCLEPYLIPDDTGALNARLLL
jgi:hypothetical protein